MSTKQGSVLRLGGYLLLALLLVVLAAMFALSYTAGLALLAGIALAWLGLLVLPPLIRWLWVGRWRLAGLLLLLVVGLVLAAGCWLLTFRTLPRTAFTGVEDVPALQPPEVTADIIVKPQLSSYRVTIEPANPELTRFQVREQIVLKLADGQERLIRLAAREVDSAEQGFLLREATLAPLQVDQAGYIKLTLPDGTSLDQSLCDPTCPESTVALVDFPRHAFYAARDAGPASRSEYTQTETVVWSVWNLERGVVFAYVPPPWHQGSSLLQPFLGLSTFKGWLLALVGVVGTILINPLLQALLPDIVIDQLKSLVRRILPRRQSAEQS